jgi:hypothetical protein
MANKDAAFGLKPIGKVGQNADNGGLTEYSITNNDSSAIYFQDVVKATAAGTIDVAAAGSTGLVGSLNGVFYTDPSSGKPTWKNYYPGSVAAADIVAFVADDPYQRFEIQADSTVGAADVFLNADITYRAGDSANYVSRSELAKGTVGTTSNLQLKILGISKDPENSDTASNNVNCVVTINEHLLKGAVAGL